MSWLFRVLSKFAHGDVHCPPAESMFCKMGLFPLKQWIVLMYWWVRQYPDTDDTQDVEVEEKAAIQAYQYCRSICIRRLLNRDSPLMLGGPEVVVQLDESLFRHKPKVSQVEQVNKRSHTKIYYSTIVGMHQGMKCGCLACVTKASLQP